MAGGPEEIANAAPLDAPAEGGSGEIYGVEEWDERGEKSPGPGVGLEFMFVGGQKVGDGDPADGSFYGGEKHDQDEDERGGKPKLADGNQLDDFCDAENYRGAIEEMRARAGKPNFRSVHAGDGDLSIGEVEKVFRVGVVKSGN